MNPTDWAGILPKLPDRIYFRIGEVAELLGVETHVIRYWEQEFAILSPEKSSSGQRLFRHRDVENLFIIKHLLYIERYSIEGARRKLREVRKLLAQPAAVVIPSEEGLPCAPETTATIPTQEAPSTVQPGTLVRPDFGLEAWEPGEAASSVQNEEGIRREIQDKIESFRLLLQENPIRWFERKGP